MAGSGTWACIRAWAGTLPPEPRSVGGEAPHWLRGTLARLRGRCDGAQSKTPQNRQKLDPRGSWKGCDGTKCHCGVFCCSRCLAQHPVDFVAFAVVVSLLHLLRLDGQRLALSAGASGYRCALWLGQSENERHSVTCDSVTTKATLRLTLLTSLTVPFVDGIAPRPQCGRAQG